ncbi:MAG: hypothetical protein GY711_03960 [bacterium]|nr:hypothetical protein [bacterium]
MQLRHFLLLPVAAIAFFAVGWMLQPSESHHYIAKREDNVCGPRHVRQLSNPARVDYDRLIAATPESKRMKKEGIDPSSPEGLILRSRGAKRVLDACQRVRREARHCSIWRAIRRRDGKPIPDVTDLVLGRMRKDGVGAEGAPLVSAARGE